MGRFDRTFPHISAVFYARSVWGNATGRYVTQCYSITQDSKQISGVFLLDGGPVWRGHGAVGAPWTGRLANVVALESEMRSSIAGG